jgi:hypothetical protein
VDLQPGFVIKTTLQTLHAASSAPPLTKLFINVSSAEQVPPPSEEKTNPLCTVGAVQSTTDKGKNNATSICTSTTCSSSNFWCVSAGNRSLVIDATLNTGVLIKAKNDKSYKQWLIQWALEKVEEKMGVELSRSGSKILPNKSPAILNPPLAITDYSEPNIKSKGTLTPRKAVLPIPVVQRPATSDKIQVVKADSVPASVMKSPTLVRTNSTSIQSKRKPKTEFEVVDGGAAFVFKVEIPEEVRPWRKRDTMICSANAFFANAANPKHFRFG